MAGSTVSSVKLIRIFICLASFTVISGLRCPLYWQQNGNGNECYRFRFKNLKNWTDAEAWCKQQNSDLVKLETVTERNWLMLRIKQIQNATNSSNVEFWSGLNRLNPTSAGKYTWADGSPVNSSVLQSQAMNPMATNANCVKFVNNNGRKLGNDACGKLNGYICERHIGIPLTCNADAGWQSFNNFCYKVHWKEGGTWDTAQQQCDHDGGNLFTVESNEEESVIDDFAKNLQKDYWIGLKTYPKSNSYTWLMVPNNSTLYPRLTYWNTVTAPQVPSTQYNNTCAYVAYNTDSSQISWKIDRCNVKKNYVCKRPEGTCQPGWIAHQNRCYQLNTQYLLSWQQASQYCRSEGGGMVAIYGYTAINFLNSFLSQLQEARISSIWIGATDNSTANYTWSYGQKINYQNWFQNPPTNTPNRQDCVYISTNDAKGRWQTTPNCGLKKAFICTIGFDAPVKAVTTPKPTLRCDDHWTLNSGTCFQFNDTQVDYLTAQESCKAQGGYLATVDNNNKHSFIINRIQNNAYWIGLTDRNQNRKYVWNSNGVQSTFFKWCPNEPNDYGGTESCVEYVSKCWNDQKCTATLRYICSKPPQNIPVGPPITTTPIPFSSKCGAGWEERPQSQYCYSYQDDQLSWQDARQVCQHMGGDLASIHSREEQVYIQTRISTLSSFWLWVGGTDRTKEGGWGWVDGTPFQFLNWAGGEPNGQTRENCIQIYSRLRNQQWNDGNCNTRSGFVCKKLYGQTSTVPPRSTPVVPAGQYLGCPVYWKKFGNSCWYFKKGMMSTTDARATCQKNGGYLATINSDDEQAFVYSNLPKPFKAGKPGIFKGGGFAIGLSDRVAENVFQWDDNTPVMYTNWAPNEPNNWKNLDEDCTGVWLLDGGWFDVNCGTPLPGYICRKGVQVVQSTGNSPLLTGCQKPNRGIGYGASCYKIRTGAPLSWQDAQNTCKTSFGGNLATVGDRYVQSFLSSYIDTLKDYFWIGLSDPQSTGTYSWVQGQTAKFTFWYNTHTGNSRGTCVAMRGTHPIGLWEDKNCTDVHNYICETPRTGFTNAPTTPAPILPCPTGWSPNSYFCYKAYSTVMTWIQARDFCRGLGGDVVSVHSQQENDFVFTMTEQRTSYWLGINDWDREGTWVWSDGSGVSFTAWNPNEPNNWNNQEDCAILVGNNKWVDIGCFSKIKPLCKRVKGIPFITTTVPPIGITSIACGVESMWIFYMGACYMTNPPNGRSNQLTWYDARKYCNRYGSDLASVHSSSENNFLFSQAKKLFKEEYWIGLNELEAPGKLRWIDNSSVDFISWDQGEPNDQYGREKCTALKALNGNWNDENCNMKLGFVCKKKVGQSGPITQPTTVIQQGGCPKPNFVPSTYSNKCFYVSKTTSLMTWNQSVQYCQNTFGAGYDIASISNSMEQALLTSLIQGFTSNVWIGLNDLKLNRQFAWNDNSQVKYVNWNSGEPNGRTSLVKGQGFVAFEQCVEMVSQGGSAGFWNDKNCQELRYPLCQGPKVQGLPTPNPQGSCTKQGYVSRGTSCYKFVKSPVQTWQMAEKLCQGDGGVLASVNNVFENAFIVSQMGLNTQYWIGLKYDKTTSTFNWQKKWPVLYTSWFYGEPSDGPNDICVKSTNWLWNAVDCSNTLGYVCEINSAQVPAPTPAPLGHCLNPNDAVYGDYCYNFNPFKSVDWPSAQYNCEKIKMGLVSISNAAELNFVFTVMLNARDRRGRSLRQNIWIGLNKGLSSGFQWTDNTGVSYTNWNSGEPSDPSNSTVEECVEMYRDSAKWNDVDCSQQRAFICKGRTLGGLGPTPTYPSFGPPSTTPPQFITFPNIFPFQTGTAPRQVQTTKSKGPTTQPQGVTPGRIPTFKPPTLPSKTPRVTPKPNTPVVTFHQPTGHINGPKDQRQNNVTNKKHGLTGGSLAAVIVVIMLVIGIVFLIGVLWWRKRNPNVNRLSGPGFDNALYTKGNDNVDIDSTA